MKSKVWKNIIALLAYFAFLFFLLFKFNEFNQNRNIYKEVLENKQSVTEEKEEKVESTEESDKNTESVLDQYYNENNINIERILSADESIYKEKIIELLNRFAVSDLKEIIGKERLDYIKQYEGVKIVGDSNVRHFDYYQVLEKEFYYPLAGKSIDYQAKHAREYVDSNTKTIVFWNGYNIANYNNAEEYVSAYQELVDSVKKINANTDVYICSLMPATEKAIEDDLKGELVHHIYRGREYDAKLKEHFGDHYIDIKFIGREKYYGNDGIHFMPQFYYMLIPYLAYYLSL